MSQTMLLFSYTDYVQVAFWLFRTEYLSAHFLTDGVVDYHHTHMHTHTP